MKLPIFLSASLLLGSSLFANSDWEQSVSMGLTMTKGNSDTSLFNGKYDGQKTKEKTKLKLGLEANIGEDNNKKTTDDYSAKAQYNVNITEHFYWLIATSIDVDQIADLDHRFLLGPGLGHIFIKNDKKLLDLEAGLSYIREKFNRAKADSSVAFRLAQNFSQKISASAKLWEGMEYLGNFDDFNDYIFKIELGVQTTMTKRLSLKSFVRNTHNNLPAAGKKDDDTSFVTMLVYNF